jgi:heme/copper-type cytochrome/quinol oxidase subunit 3
MQSTFMDEKQEGLQALHDIRRIMEQSSRFISLSGWSGIGAGICALIGAVVANNKIEHYYAEQYGTVEACTKCLARQLLLIAILVFISALVLAILFTWMRSRKAGIPLWGNSARRLLWNTLVPIAAGGLVVIRMAELGYYQLVAPTCLIFYGMALINGSKFTLGEVKFLGYLILATGLVNLWMPSYGLYFWALGFGMFHIFYGLIMWWKYERTEGKA